MLQSSSLSLPCPQRKSRWLFASGLLVLTGLLFWAMAIWGEARTWDFLSVPHMKPDFADSYGIIAGSKSAARGFDPLIENPADPYGRRMDYPRIWHLLFHLGLKQGDTALLAGIFIGFFLLGLMLVMRDASGLAILIQLVCLASPAVCFCIERGNNDLFVFFVVALAIWALEQRPWLSAVLVGFGFLLKLFPLVTLAIFCGPERKGRWLIVSAVGFGAAAYLLVQHKEIHRILTQNESVSGAWSFDSTKILVRYIARVNMNLPSFVELAAAIAVSALVGIAAWAAWKWPSAASRRTMQLAAFRAGTAIYMITFCGHASYSYRLIFLLFVIPQLVEWAQGPEHSKSCIAGITLLAALISLWDMGLQSVWILLPGEMRYGWLFVQCGYWILLAGLVYLGLNTALQPRPASNLKSSDKTNLGQRVAS
ncbi:MAG TPA: glycosyltransferase family 87 protein [Opitutaceae bacterium]|jgi:hypothetical protein|nr:glycosyltransferase family 87 protein [Opitutaceae bacterium]